MTLAIHIVTESEIIDVLNDVCFKM